MAHVQWCIGNTTLREAVRLKGGKGVNTVAAIRLANKLIDLKKQNASLKELKKRFLFYYLRLKSSSWKDCIDVAARYFRMSGLLTIHRSRIHIAEPHGEMVEWILFVFRKDWNC